MKKLISLYILFFLLHDVYAKPEAISPTKSSQNSFISITSQEIERDNIDESMVNINQELAQTNQSRINKESTGLTYLHACCISITGIASSLCINSYLQSQQYQKEE